MNEKQFNIPGIIDMGAGCWEWVVPEFILWDIFSQRDGADYKPETFPPPCTNESWTGIIGEN